MPDATATAQYECPDCDWRGDRDDMDPILDVDKRVSPGEFMAAGECPDCDALIPAADDEVPDYVIEDAIRLALSRGLLIIPSFTLMTLALGLVADTSDNKISVLTHDQLRNLVTDLRDAAAVALPPIRVKGMALVRSADKRPVHVGDRLYGHYSMHVIKGGEPPRPSSSSGRVHTDQGVYVPSVIDCEWIADEPTQG